jgi:2-dehydropantoate 2-reductase
MTRYQPLEALTATTASATGRETNKGRSTNMRILVVGAGAIGATLGAHLMRTADVQFLARPSRARVINADGLQYIDPAGVRTTVAANAVTSSAIGSEWDLVIVAVKEPALNAVIRDLQRAVSPTTVVLPLLSGFRHLDRLRTAFADATILGGLAVISAALNPDGAIQSFMTGVSLRIGALDGEANGRAEEIAALADGQGIDITVVDDISQEMWEQWMLTAASAAANVLLGGSMADITAVLDGSRTVASILAEAAATIGAAGHQARQGTIERAALALSAPRVSIARASSTTAAAARPFETSVYRDYQAGARTEAEAVIGDLARLAQDLRVPAPLLSAAAVRLRVYERSL